MKNSQYGFTIIEILVCILILGILTAVITSTLTGALAINQASQMQIDSTVKAQRTLENVRDLWQSDASAYNGACINSNIAIPENVAIKFVNVDSNGKEYTAPGNEGAMQVVNDTSTCAVRNVEGSSYTGPPPMRRIIASTTNAKNKVTTLELNVLPPN